MLRAHGQFLVAVAASILWGCGEDGPTESTSPLPPPPPPPPEVRIWAISPRNVIAGGPDLTLTITGANFSGSVHYRSQAVWVANQNNTLLTTTFVSDTRLTAVIPAALVAQAGTRQVFVQTGDPAGDLALETSNKVSFWVNAPTPSGPCWTCLSIAISPTSAPAGSDDLVLTITGSGFRSGVHVGSRVVWLGVSDRAWLATTFVSDNELTAAVPAALLTEPGVAQVFVETGDVMGDLPLKRSAAATFTVTPSDSQGTGTIIVYGRTSSLGPRYKGYREVALDGSAWQGLREGDSLIYSPVASGVHQLRLSNPCTGTHEPSVQYVSAVVGDTVTVGVYIPPLCE